MTTPQDIQDGQAALSDNAAARSAASQFQAAAPTPEQAVRAYGAQMSRHRQDALIVQYLPLVHRIVQQVGAYLRPPLSRDDLVSAGTIGLVKAARDYDASKDAEFKTYAYIRIRGAVIDELRGWSFTPPTTKKLLDQVSAAADRHLQQHGTPASDEYIAKALGLTLDKLYQVYETARARHFLSISGGGSDDDPAPALGNILAADGEHLPEDRLAREELQQALAGAIETLPEKQRHIILLYYHRQLTMKQVSEVMDLTESRISQLHAAALFKLSAQLKQWHPDDAGKSERNAHPQAVRSL